MTEIAQLDLTKKEAAALLAATRHDFTMGIEYVQSGLEKLAEAKRRKAHVALKLKWSEYRDQATEALVSVRLPAELEGEVFNTALSSGDLSTYDVAAITGVPQSTVDRRARSNNPDGSNDLVAEKEQELRDLQTQAGLDPDAEPDTTRDTLMYGIYEAIQTLASAPNAKKVAADVPEWERNEIEGLETAIQWLETFRKALK